MDGHPPRVGVGLAVPTSDDVAASSGTGRDLPVLCRDVAATASLGELAERVSRLERIVEQIGGVLLPQNMKDIVEGMQHVPEERVQNSVVEQIGCVPAPQIWEPIVESVQVILQERENRTQQQIVEVPVPRIMEAAVGRGSCACYTTGTRAASHPGTDRGFATDHGRTWEVDTA